MRLNQISVFLENAPGRLEKVCKALSDAGVNLDTLMTIETADFGIVRLIADDPDAAERALKNEGIAASKIEVLAVEVEDRPGALLKILSKMRSKGVNVEYMYAMTKPLAKNSVMVMSFKDIDAAEKILGLK